MRSEHYDIALLLDGCNEAQLTALLADLDLPRATSAEEQRIAQRFFQKVGGTVSMESDPNGIVVPVARADHPIRKQQWYSLAAVACLTLALVASAVYLLQIPRPQISESSLPDAGTTSTTSSTSSTISTASSDIPTAVSSVPENTLPTGTLSDETSTTVHTTTATISKPTNLLSSTTTTTTTVPYTSTPPMTTVPTSSFTTTATPPFIFTTTPPFIVTSTTAIHSEWFETTTQIETVADTTETTTVAELVPSLPPIQPMTAMVVRNKSYSD